MKVIKGDLIKLAKEGEFKVIVHGCNCFCNMGAGIAKQIKKEFPGAYTEDCLTQKGDKNKLGSISYDITSTDYGDIAVVNAYTQYHYGRGLQVDYKAIGSCFRKVKILAGDMRIGYPMIGAGLAGGDWEVISKIIDCELEGCDHTLVKLER